MANQFWQRWRTEFLNNLQKRQKWTSVQRNMEKGDIVIVKDDQKPRCSWSLAKVVECYPSEDGLVRKVKLMMADKTLDKYGKRRQPATLLDRPVHKLILFLSTEDQGIPRRGANQE